MKHFSFTQYLRSCFFIFISLIPLEIFAQYYSARIYKDEPGMVSNRIYDLTQRPNGEMWFATQEGINRYDGLEWTAFPDSMRFLPHHGKIKLISAADSSLYIIGINYDQFALKKYKDNKWTELQLPKELTGIAASGSFNLCVSPADQSLFISYGRDVFLYENGSWTKISLDLPHGATYVHQIKHGSDGLWVATDKGLLLYHDGKTRSMVEGLEIFDLYIDPESNAIYLLGADWIGMYHHGKFSKLLEDKQIGLLGPSPFSSLTKKGDFLYYSLNSPLHSFNLKTKKLQLILSDTFNKDYTCMQAFFDREGNLWIATLRGAFKISNLYIYSYNRNQLVENEVSAILEASNGDVYLGNNSGFNILKPDGEILTYDFPNTFLQLRVMDIVEHSGSIFFAAHSAGIVEFRNGKLRYFLPEGQSTRALDLQIFQGRLLAAVNSKVYEKTPLGWKHLLTSGEHQNSTPFIRKIFWDEEDRLFLTPNGIYDCDKKQYYLSRNLHESDTYTAIRYKGKVYLGTTAGMMELRNGKIVPAFPTKDRFSKPVYSFLIDRESRLWAGTEHGIIHHDTYYNLIHISKANGLIGNEVNRNAFVQLRNGRILIGTDEGLSIYTPVDNPSYPEPSVELTKVTVNGEAIQDKVLDHDENQLRFYFRGISFYNEDLVNYRVKFSGFEDDWQYLPYHNQRSVSYTNLQPGSYRFLLQARVSDGAWSRILHSGLITIQPAYYEASWFRLLLIACLAGVIFGVVRYRSRHLKSQNDTLEMKINEKTRALNEQNAQLLKTINDLKSTQGQLIQSEKLASMGHLTAGIAHEMNNPLNYIRGGAECLKQNLLEITELYHKINKSENSKKANYLKEYEYLIHESNQLIDSILSGAEKSTHIVKSLSSFTADAQNFYSFVDLEREVETALTLLNNHIGFRITINRFFGNIPRLECYPARINQMLVNILLNAIQAISGEGEITIRIYRKNIDKVALEITDDGDGIDLEDEEKVFEPFFTTKDNNPGLGLTIVKSIIQDHHGEINFLSRKDRGTKVVVILPLQQTAHPELEPVQEIVKEEA